MRLADFLYWLLNEQGEPLVGDPRTGMIQTGSKDTLLAPDGRVAFLSKSPDGWRDTLVKFVRNAKYRGLFRDFTVPMRFPYDGALLLRYLYWTYGIEAYAKLVIHKSDRTTWPVKHKTYYSGEIDFSKFKQGKIGDVTVNVMEGGLSKMLKANENVKYSIPIDTDPEHKDVLMDGMKLFNSGTYAVGGGISNTVFENRHALSVVFINADGNSSGTLFATQILESISNIFTYVTGSTNYFLSNTTEQTIDYRITGELKYKCTVNDIDAAYRFDLFKSTGGGTPIPVYDSTLALVEGQVYTATIDTTVTLEPGEHLFWVNVFYGLFSPGSIEVAVEFIDSSQIKVEFESKYRPTKVKGLTLFRLLQKLVEQISEGRYTAKSDWLQAKKDIIVTSGDALRQIITKYDENGDVVSKGAVIKTSFAEFFQSLTSHWSIGVSVENDQLVMEPIEHFYQEGVGLTLTNVDDCEFSPADDLMINKIKVGGPNVEYNDVNGKYEPNQGQEYLAPLTRITRDLDLVSPYRSDPYGIEFTRRNLDGKTTTDDSSDNDTFLLNVREGQYTFSSLVSFIGSSNSMLVPYNTSLEAGDIIEITGSGAGNNGTATVVSVTNLLLVNIAVLSGITVVDEASVTVQIQVMVTASLRLNRPVYDSITGVPDPLGIFNLELSPKRGLMANGRLLRSLLHLRDDKEVKFTTADKNAELSTTSGGITITENANIEVADLGPHLFYPVYVKITTTTEFNLQAYMDTVPYNEIEFPWKGNRWKAFLWDGGIKPATLDRQEWKLILSPNNDLQKLINV